MTEDKKPFIFVEFDEFGSIHYKISVNQITSSQLFLISGLLGFQAHQTYMNEQMEIKKQNLSKPTEGIIKP